MKLILFYFLHFIGIKTEGLFRVPGAKARIDMVRGREREGERERVVVVNCCCHWVSFEVV